MDTLSIVIVSSLVLHFLRGSTPACLLFFLRRQLALQQSSRTVWLRSARNGIMAGAGIGMMDPAYFVGRREILSWLNGTFHMNLNKIEETASGAVACQVLDAIYPGEVPMSKVRWDAKSPHEFIDNYKVIQSVFEKKGIDKHIEVEKLMRAKYQDNLENMQWFKSFFGKNYAGQPYDPIARRAKGKGADSTVAFALDASKRGKPADDAEEPQQRPPVPVRTTVPSQGVKKAAPVSEQPRKAAASLSTSNGPSRPTQAAHSLQGVSGQAVNLSKHVEELQVTIESLEKERDFYFGKLRDIEVLLQAYNGPDEAVKEQILQILYATDEDFVPVDPVTGQPMAS